MKETYYVTGMTCVGCQRRIEKSLKKVTGIKNVEVNLQTGQLNCEYDDKKVSEDEIIKQVELLGYGISKNEKSSAIKSIGLFGVIIGIFMLVSMLGIQNLLVPGNTASSNMSYGMLLLLGLTTSVHCIAMCGGINLSQSQKYKKAVFEYNIGRVLCYTLLGFVLGLLGQILGTSFPGMTYKIQGILKMAAGLAMFYMGLSLLNIVPKINLKSLTALNTIKVKGPFLIGLLNGFMPCGPLQSIEVVSFGSMSAIHGAWIMLLFGIGTLPLMIGFGKIIQIVNERHLKYGMQIGYGLICVMGLSLVAQGSAISIHVDVKYVLTCIVILFLIAIVVSKWNYKIIYAIVGILLVSLITTVSLQKAEIRKTADNHTETDIQEIKSEISSYSYPSITVDAGKKVIWTVSVKQEDLNGCNEVLIIPSLNIEKELQVGDNVIEFIIDKPGKISYSCWMGMIRGTITAK